MVSTAACRQAHFLLTDMFLSRNMKSFFFKMINCFYGQLRFLRIRYSSAGLLTLYLNGDGLVEMAFVFQEILQMHFGFYKKV